MAIFWHHSSQSVAWNISQETSELWWSTPPDGKLAESQYSRQQSTLYFLTWLTAVDLLSLRSNKLTVIARKKNACRVHLRQAASGPACWQLGNVTSSSKWPFDTTGAISYRCSIVTESVSPAFLRYWAPYSGSRHVIGHVTIRFAMPFPIGGSWEPSLYLLSFLRYSAPKHVNKHTNILMNTPTNNERTNQPTNTMGHNNSWLRLLLIIMITILLF